MILVDVYTTEGEPRDLAVSYLYKLLAERAPNENISHMRMPDFQDHATFIRRRPYRAWYTVCTDNFDQVGAVYATQANEVGIQIEASQQRKGYAHEALVRLMEVLDPLPVGRGKWLANVNPKNFRSKALFEKKFNGRIIQLTYELEGRNDGKGG